MPTIEIDGRLHEVEDGLNLLEAATRHGHDLPYFCWHPALGSIGACRQCAVRVYASAEDKQGRIVMACMTAAGDGVRCSIADPEAAEMRAAVIEWLMINHPHDCPVCDEGGECQLQDMTMMAGHSLREYRFLKRTFRNQDLGPFVHHEMNRCIQCYRCVRFYNGYAGGTDLAALGAHDHVYFGRHAPGTLESPFSGNLVEVCPTGVFTDKTYRRHYVRKWDLATAPSICPHCASGCNITPGERAGLLRRVRNRLHPDINGWFLCDRGRYGYEFVNRSDRLRVPLLRGQPVDEAGLAAFIAGLKGRKIAGIGSPRASLEDNFALQTLVGEARFFSGLLARDLALLDTAARRMREIAVASLGEIEREVDAALVLGEDVLNTAPRLALALRQAARHAPVAQARARLNLPAWDDQALRDAVQEATGPLFVVSPDQTELDAVALGTLRVAPQDVARFGFAVAHALGGAVPEVSLPEDQRALAGQVADALAQAARPLVVSGTGLGSQEILEASAAIARALGSKARLSLALPEANSLGLALLGGRSLEEACALAQDGGIEGLVILENDLFRRAPAPFVEALLEKCGTIVALDALPSQTTARAELVLPAATFAESAGTFVSSEGRAQRFFSVFEPHPVVRSGWRWVAELGRAWQHPMGEWAALDEVIALLAERHPQLASIREAAEPASWRHHGQRAPREPHRFSGRTALQAHLTLHEQPPPRDPDSPLSYSMEGTRDPLPPSLRSFEWAPGWNSEQAAVRLTSEARQAGYRSGSGVRLLQPADGPASASVRQLDIPAPFARLNGRFLLLDAPLVLGTEELSSQARAIETRIPAPWVALSAEDAAEMGVRTGDLLEVVLGDTALVLPLQESQALPRGLAKLPRDLPSLQKVWGVALPAWTEIRPHGGGR